MSERTLSRQILALSHELTLLHQDKLPIRDVIEVQATLVELARTAEMIEAVLAGAAIFGATLARDALAQAAADADIAISPNTAPADGYRDPKVIQIFPMSWRKK